MWIPQRGRQGALRLLLYCRVVESGLPMTTLCGSSKKTSAVCVCERESGPCAWELVHSIQLLSPSKMICVS